MKQGTFVSVHLGASRCVSIPNFFPKTEIHTRFFVLCSDPLAKGSATTSTSYQGYQEAWRYLRKYVAQWRSIFQLHRCLQFHFLSKQRIWCLGFKSFRSTWIHRFVLAPSASLGKVDTPYTKHAQGFEPPLLQGHSVKEKKWQVNQQIVIANHNYYTLLSILHSVHDTVTVCDRRKMWKPRVCHPCLQPLHGQIQCLRCKFEHEVHRCREKPLRDSRATDEGSHHGTY